MNEFSQGFLSKDAEATAQVVRDRYTRWRNVLLEANGLAISHQHSILIHQDNSREVYGAVLFARTISSVQASVLLLERGLVPQARSVLRSALESYFALAAIAVKPEIVERLIQTHEAEQKRIAKYMGQWKHPELQDIARTHAANYGKFLSSTASAISTYGLAEAGGNEDWYRTVYTVFSWSVHAAPFDLERHLVIGESREISEFRNEPEIEDQESSWSCGIELLTKSIRSLGAIFSGLGMQRLDSIEHQHIELMKEL